VDRLIADLSLSNPACGRNVRADQQRRTPSSTQRNSSLNRLDPRLPPEIEFEVGDSVVSPHQVRRQLIRKGGKEVPWRAPRVPDESRILHN